MTGYVQYYIFFLPKVLKMKA